LRRRAGLRARPAHGLSAATAALPARSRRPEPDGTLIGPMNVTTSPAPRSSVLLEIELPPEQLSRAVDQAVKRLGRRTKVPGFRPGKAPRAMLERVLGPGVVLDDAVDHLVQ